jgi:hypothetical protein
MCLDFALGAGDSAMNRTLKIPVLMGLLYGGWGDRLN